MAEEKTPEAQNSTQLRSTVENKAPKPAGLLPKNTQQLVILGVAVVMVLIMWLTGSGKRRPLPPRLRQQARVCSLRTRQRSKISNRRSSRNRQRRGSPSRLQTSLGFKRWALPAMYHQAAHDAARGNRPGAGRSPRWRRTGTQPPPDPVKEDKKKREYLSLFAPNVAFTYRKGQEAEQLVGSHGATQSSDTEHATSAHDQRIWKPKSARQKRSLWQQGKQQRARPGECAHYRRAAKAARREARAIESGRIPARRIQLVHREEICGFRRHYP